MTVLCTAAVFCTGLFLVLPDHKTAPLMKTLLALFFTLCLLSPIESLRSADMSTVLPSAAESDEETLSAAFYDSLRTQTDTALRQIANDTLKDSQYHIEEIRAEWQESADGNIYITRAVAYVSSDQAPYRAEIERRLNQTIGISVTVVSIAWEMR